MVKFGTPQYKCPNCTHVMNVVPDKCPSCGFDFTKKRPTKVEGKRKFQTVLLEHHKVKKGK